MENVPALCFAKRSRALLTAALLAALSISSCGGSRDGHLLVSDLNVFAPVPGSTTAVAYFELANPAAQAATLTRVSSPQFQSVEMHETVLNDGVSTMRPLESVVVSSDSSVQFVAGGKHLMLMRPVGPVASGDRVELRFQFENGEVVVVTASLQSRFDKH